ncbi:hypothetical protein DFQ03_1822 [Maribacter caenipelagi]|uniref:Uncharacterized protein n=1 Tax=Maribacter caenipelagi TaxID=1447781 RepID=A0A4R7D4D9_9FLAO|nr:hypothetical protein DFQ03_1822 [Maribacter caenipelagi]
MAFLNYVCVSLTLLLNKLILANGMETKRLNNLNSENYKY